MKEYLEQAGEYCEFLTQDNLSKSYFSGFYGIILPLPSSLDGKKINTSFDLDIDKFVEYISKNQVVFGGMLKGSLINKLLDADIMHYDYYKREETIIANAYATAQGVTKLILNESKKMLSESEILITGYGRTGKAISKQLKALNANITVSVRNYRDIALSHAEGIKAIFYDEIVTVGKTFDFVINTVPTLVIDKDIIDSFNHKAILIEIASAPYGFDIDYIHEKNLTFNLASSLPGKAVPVSAGRILGRSIEHIIKEENLFM